MTGNRRGFTLIELMAVVSIVMVLMLMASLQLDFLVPKYRLRGVVREVGAMMRQARSKAVASGKDVYVEFDLSQSRYWILAPFPKREEDKPEGAIIGYQYEAMSEWSLPRDVEITEVILGEKVRVDRGVARVKLSPLGASAHAIVNFRNTDGRVMAVKLNGFTGSLTFYEAHKGPEALLEDSGP